MAVAFVAAGALATNATTTTLNVVAPSLSVDDIMVAAILGKDNQVITAPSGWSKFVEVNNGTAQRCTLAWKRAVAGDSGATFAFTKPTDNNLLFCGVISAWSGCVTSGTPIDATAPTTSPNASSDTVTYATFDPTETTGHVVAIGVYNDDATTAGTISGTNPTLANRWDLETNIGSDGSIFGYSGDSDGAATGARSHSTTSTTDAVNIGCLFGLIAQSGVALVKVQNETEETSEGTVRLMAQVREKAETEETSEGVLKILGVVKQAAETEQTTEGTVRVLGIVKQRAETEETSEGVVKLLTLIRVQSETQETSESVSGLGYRFYGTIVEIDPADYGGTTAFFFEAVLSTTAGGTARAKLYDLTTGADVTGSTVSTASTTAVRVRSGAITLASGSKDYRAMVGVELGKTTTIQGARVVVEQT